MNFFGGKGVSWAALLSLAGLALLGIVCLVGQFVAPYNFDDESVESSYAPPSKIHLLNPETKQLGLFVYPITPQVDRYYRRVYQEDSSQIYRLKFFVQGFDYKLFGVFKTNLHLFGVENSRVYLLGADLKGRDIFSRIIFGCQISLSAALLAGLVSLILGITVGAVAGYFAGKVDNVLMRLCEVFISFPAFYLMLAMRAAFPPNLTSLQLYFMIILILSFIGWASLARIVRGMVLELRERDFVLAAKSCGLPAWLIIWRNVLPHTLSFAFATFLISLPGFILGESALSLIGLGIQDPYASLGNLLADAMSIVNIRLYPWILSPAVVIAAVTLWFNLLGEFLRDRFDPKVEGESQ